MGHIQQHSVQCVLIINMFNEKIFIFLWFWFHILFIESALSLIFWAIVLLIPYFRKEFIIRHLELADTAFDSQERSVDVDHFVKRYLRCDGVFVTRIIRLHCGVIMATDIISLLWKSFFGIESQVKRQQSTRSERFQTLQSSPQFTFSKDINMDKQNSLISHRNSQVSCKMVDGFFEESGNKDDNETSKLAKNEEDENGPPFIKTDVSNVANSTVEYYDSNFGSPNDKFEEKSPLFVNEIEQTETKHGNKKLKDLNQLHLNEQKEQQENVELQKQEKKQNLENLMRQQQQLEKEINVLNELQQQEKESKQKQNQKDKELVRQEQKRKIGFEQHEETQPDRY